MTLEGSFLICPTGRKYGAAGLAETVSGAASRDDRIFVVKVYFKIETCLDCHAVKKGLLGALHLACTRRTWGEECALAR